MFPLQKKQKVFGNVHSIIEVMNIAMKDRNDERKEQNKFTHFTFNWSFIAEPSYNGMKA